LGRLIEAVQRLSEPQRAALLEGLWALSQAAGRSASEDS
jgi:hypothetical protein